MTVIAALATALVASTASAANPAPAPLQGAWVPASAGCDSPLRIQVAANQLTLVNGADRQTLGGNEMAGPGYFAPGYRGIQAVLITEFDGHQPATMTFSAGRAPRAGPNESGATPCSRSRAALPAEACCLRLVPSDLAWLQPQTPRR